MYGIFQVHTRRWTSEHHPLYCGRQTEQVALILGSVDANRKRYVAWEFLRKISATTRDSQQFDAALEEFRSAPLEHRSDVASGFLAIAGDASQPIFKRSMVLTMLAAITPVCSLENKSAMEDQLCALVQDHAAGLARGNPRAGAAHADNPSLFGEQRMVASALLALVVLNRALGLQKLDELIARHIGSEFGEELRRMRDTFSGN